MGKSIQLGKIFGIPFRLDYTWFIIFIYVTVLLSYSYFPGAWPPLMRWSIGILTSLLFFASVVTHELAHSLVGIRGGIPVKSITLFVFGGVAQITREPATPMGELKMASAGPLASLAIGALFYAIYLLALGANQYVAALAWWLAWINVVLAIFNMIPGFPLDGGRVFRSIVWHFTGNYIRATRIASQAGQVTSYLLILGGIAMLFSGAWLNALLLVIIGWVLNGAARTSYRQAVIRDTLSRLSARDMMARDCPLVPHYLTIRQLVQERLLFSSRHCFLVADGDSAGGLLTLRQIKELPREHWDITTTRQAMTPLENLKAVSPGDDAISVLEAMDGANVNEVAVVSEGRVVGIILRDDLLRFAQRAHQLKM